MSLDTIEQQILDYHRADTAKEIEFFNSALYDRVAIGLCLLKAQSLHLCATVARRSKKGQLESADGFSKWLEDFTERHPEVKRRSAYNYINAARNAGLTTEHTIEDVEAMRSAQALHGKTAKELYRIKDAVAETPAEEELPPAPSLVKDTLRDCFTYCDQVIVLKDQMEPEEYEAAHTRLHATLEKLTGARWIMASEAEALDGAEHGEQRLTKADRQQIMADQKARWAKKKKATEKKGAKRK